MPESDDILKGQKDANPHKIRIGVAFYSKTIYMILIYLSIYHSNYNLAAVLQLWEEKGEHERKHITEH